MHDPLVVAFEIRRPWPRRDRAYDKKPGRVSLHSWRGPFWVIGGKGFYWPTMVTVWHREPGGHDSGEVCQHYVKRVGTDGKYHLTILNGWRFHVHHWKIQVSPLQELRRRLLTRCAWCGGRSRKRDSVNHSLSWDGPRGRWWRGEPGLYHGDCASIYQAHAACLCESPVLDHGGYGRCARCSGFRRFGATADELDRQRLLAAIPDGERDREVYQQVCEMAKVQS